MTLDQVRPGWEVIINAIMGAAVKDRIIRLGLAEGSRVLCLERIPSGPVVLRKGFLEMALGQELCRKITVQRVEPI